MSSILGPVPNQQKRSPRALNPTSLLGSDPVAMPLSSQPPPPMNPTVEEVEDESRPSPGSGGGDANAAQQQLSWAEVCKKLSPGDDRTSWSSYRLTLYGVVGFDM